MAKPKPRVNKVKESELNVESRGIQRVLPSERVHKRVSDLGTFWFSANFVLTTVITGSLSAIFGLGTIDALVAIVIFNLISNAIVAYLSTLGPKTGLRMMTISRFSFGWTGAQVMALFNIAACLGWSTVNAMVAGALASSVTGLPYWLCVIVIALATITISVWGYHIAHQYQRYAWIPLAVTFLIMTVVALPHIHNIPTPTWGLAFAASWLTYGGAILGFGIGWASYASDYSAYMDNKISAKSVFKWSFYGEFIACVLLEFFGVILTSWMPTKFGTDLLVGAVKPLPTFFGSTLLLLCVASVIANNIPNDYSISVTVQVLGKWFEGIPRWVYSIVGGIIYTSGCLILGANVSNTLENFLLLIAYWLGPWSVIMLLEHFVYRHGKYNLEDWDTRKKLPMGWAAMAAFLIGLIGVWLGMNQTNYAGPLAHLWGMDIGFELGVLFTLVSYMILRPIELGLITFKMEAQPQLAVSKLSTHKYK